VKPAPERAAPVSYSGELATVVPADCAGLRLDQALARLFPQFTRSQVQKWIKAGLVRIQTAPAVAPDVQSPVPHRGVRISRAQDAQERPTLARPCTSPRVKVRGGERIAMLVPPAPSIADVPQAIALQIVYEDEDIVVINKPAGLVVHPGAGNRMGTLLNALLHHAPMLAALPRAGIVHRLDKETSGLLVVAKSERARQSLIEQLKQRTMSREYVTIVSGVLIAGGSVEAPIGRHRQDRKRMTVTEHGKPALSHYRVLKKYRAHTLLQVRLESGRTHQIRVHMAHIRHPVLGDPVYGGRARLPKEAPASLREALAGFHRQALHAVKLALAHPTNGERMQWSVAVPEDMHRLMEALAADARAHHKE
jgi:23S rRNA pseudouridine1911/1915/1917 synthase